MPPSSSFDLSIPKALWAFMRSVGSQGTSGNAGKLVGVSGVDAASVTPFSATPGSATIPVADSDGHLTGWVPTFTGDSGSGGAIGLVPAPAAGDAASGKVLGADGNWVFQTPQGRVFYLDPTLSSDIATYKKALLSPSTAAETTLAVTATGTTDNLLASFATEPGSPGITLLPAGTYFRHFHVKTGASNQIARVLVELYTCASDGTSETLRRSAYTVSFSGTTIQELVSSAEDPTGYIMLTTDRLVFKVYAARVSGPANCDITVYFDGTENASFVQTTILAALVVGTTAGTVCAGNDSRLSDSRTPTGSAGGDLGGTYPNPTVTQARGLRETSGPTTIPMGAIRSGEFLCYVGGVITSASVNAAILISAAGGFDLVDWGPSTSAMPDIIFISGGTDV